MIRRSVAVAASLLALSTLPAVAATPKLSGNYMVAGNQFCQVISKGKAVTSGGGYEQLMGRGAFTANSTGATATMSAFDQFGQALSLNGGLVTMTANMSITATVTGTASPYSIKLVVTNTDTKKTSTQYGKIVFGGVSPTSGIAARAVFIVSSNNGEASVNNCTMQMQLQRD